MVPAAMLVAAHLDAARRCLIEASAQGVTREDRVRKACKAFIRNEELYPDNEAEQYRSAVARHILHILDGEDS
ncbi:hypothetical protein [Microcystis phage Mae-JY09]